MAATDSIPTPVKGQAYRVTGCIKNVTTGKVITGGLTGIASAVSKDGGAFSATTSTATEIGTTGFFVLDLSATEMTADTVAIKVSATNTNATDCVFVVVPSDLTRYTVNAFLQTPVRLEQMVIQTAGRQTCTYRVDNTSASILDPVTGNTWLTGLFTPGPTGQRTILD